LGRGFRGNPRGLKETQGARASLAPICSFTHNLGAAGPERGRRFTRHESGDLQELVAAFEAALPGQDSQAYLDPSQQEVSLILEAIGAALAGRLEAASARLAGLRCELASFEDAKAGGSHLLLREAIPAERGWGLFVLNRSPSARNLVVEAPHPAWDRFTPELGAEAYLRLDARAFLLAGAHRYANGEKSPLSDMARNPHSLFQRLHELLIDAGSQVLQYHGFKRDNHPDYPNVVLSNGSERPHRELFLLKAALEARGETVGIFDGQAWRALAATGNPQARHTREIGGRFYHVETRYGLRKDPTRRSGLVETTVEALLPT
jgi:hypothetical protein